MYGELWPVVSRSLAARLSKYQLTVSGEEAYLFGFDSPLYKGGVQAEAGQLLHCMRQQIEAYTKRLQLGHSLKNFKGNAVLMKG